MPFSDMRQFLNYMGEAGHLVRVEKEVDPRYEIAAYIRKTSDQKGPGLLFENVKGHDMRVAGGLFGTLKGAALALECDISEINQKIIAGTQNPIAAKMVKDAPCQEIVHEGDDVDLFKLPIPLYSEKDSAPYITMGVTMSKDPETGARNMGLYRNELKGKNRLGISAQTVRVHLGKAEKKGQGVPVAIALGVDPAVLIAAGYKAPYGVDEVALAGGFRGAPVELVKAKTSDLEVPATAEIVIEGITLPNVREMEGPFGEYPGYYNPAIQKPVIQVTAITHRKNPIFLAGLTGMPTTENHILKQICLEPMLLWDLQQKFPGVKDVHFPAAGAQALLAVVAMRPTSKFEARNVLSYMLGNRPAVKCVIAVENDIDIRNIEQVMWAVMTRFQPAEDVIILGNLMEIALDPSGPRGGASASGTADGLAPELSSSAMGIDATRPFGRVFPEIVKVPGVENVPDFVKAS
ncbi:MAG TPA: UbiD family decarboxylase [Candidatus Binatia bacterium]|jgi:4-hydroxy-3-polyprenylbenzoate decarboxylase/2,5-furandicarboxylate decarboxylase 1